MRAKDESEQPEVEIGTQVAPSNIYIEVSPDGPYLVHGEPPIVQRFIETDHKGISTGYRDGRSFSANGVVALCRCGNSKNAPFCDGSHKNANVDLSETASFEPLLDGAEITHGPNRTLTDNESYCTFARFCDAGKRVWNEVQLGGQEAEGLTERMVHNCPGGRLLIWDNKTQQPIEVQVKPSIGLIEDPKEMCSGPLAVWGGIRIQSSNGRSYEVRTRQALCRCGNSSNKPFCDGTHASMDYKDGIAAEN